MTDVPSPKRHASAPVQYSVDPVGLIPNLESECEWVRAARGSSELVNFPNQGKREGRHCFHPATEARSPPCVAGTCSAAQLLLETKQLTSAKPSACRGLRTPHLPQHRSSKGLGVSVFTAPDDMHPRVEYLTHCDAPKGDHVPGSDGMAGYARQMCCFWWQSKGRVS